MSISKRLLERLVLVKYMLSQSRATLSSAAPFSAGLAVGQLQDSVELFLRCLAEHFDAQLKEHAAFKEIIEAVNKKLETPLSHRVSLNSLNRARVNFKHMALEPAYEDAHKLVQDMEVFIPDMAQSHLEVDFETLSLASIIGHRRTENWIREAENMLENSDCQGAVDAAAVALAVFRRHLNRLVETVNLDPFGRYRGTDLGNMLSPIEEELDDIRSLLDMVLTGVNLSQFRLFLAFAPKVSFSVVGTFFKTRSLHQSEVPTHSQARSCISFVVDAAISLKKTHVQSALSIYEAVPTLRMVDVISDDDLVIYPGDDPEILRRVVSGDRLYVLPKKLASMPGHVAIIDDGEIAYIDEKSVRHRNADENQ